MCSNHKFKKNGKKVKKESYLEFPQIYVALSDAIPVFDCDICIMVSTSQNHSGYRSMHTIECNQKLNINVAG